MSKSIIGIDMGHDSLKLALVRGKEVKKAVSVPMPVKLVNDGRIISPQTMGELIYASAKDNGLRGSGAAVCLPNETVYLRDLVMPQMTVSQLLYNLPFEFRDYVSEELSDYLYDYAIINNSAETETETGDKQPAMELTGIAVHKDVMEEVREAVRKSRFKLLSAAPTVSAYKRLVMNLPLNVRPATDEYCFLDLGYHSIRMYVFKGNMHKATRILEIGMNALDTAVAEAHNVDERLAHTYFVSNHEGCQNDEYCVAAYNNIALELLRALNFYSFSNRESQLSDVWLCGGGASITPLKKAVVETLGMRIHDASELVSGGRKLENCGSLIQAIGIAMPEGGDS